MDDAPAPRRRGRKQVTSQAEIERVAMELFVERGFDDVSVTDIATAVGMSRRSFFNYFDSKNDIVWGIMPRANSTAQAILDATPDEVGVFEALRHALTEQSRALQEDRPAYHRERMRMLLTIPVLIGHSMTEWASWRTVVAGFVGRRLGLDPASGIPQTVALAFLAAGIAGTEQWLQDDDADLVPCLEASYEALRDLVAY